MAGILLRISHCPPRARTRYSILQGRREKEKESERARNVRSGHSSTVSGLRERGPLSIGRLLRNLPLLASYIWSPCPVPFPLLLPASFPIPRVPLSLTLTISSSIDLLGSLEETLLFFLLLFFDSPSSLCFSLLIKLAQNHRGRIGYYRVKRRHYQNNTAYIKLEYYGP